jgi:ABC-type Fe3+ transport system substrate-binding protein
MKRLAILLLLSACTPEPPPSAERPEPVVVYAAFEDVENLTESFARYQEETGVYVILRRGPAQAIVDDIIADEVSPPADLLLTKSVVGAWRAAEESALRPLYSDAVAQHVPAWAADPDKFWFAIGVSEAVVAYTGDEPAVSALADLGHERFRGRLCLSSSANETNRGVIAMAISRAGGDTRPVELMVREWVANLAVGPLQAERELAAAVADGRCGIGLISRAAAASEGLEFLELPDQTANIEAIGVGRHARNPDGAAQLAEWLITRSTWPAEPGDPRENVGRLARYYDEAVLLAERARYP